MTPETGGDSWEKWQKLVLAELKRLGDCMAKLQEDVVGIRVKVATVSATVAIVVSLVVSLVMWGLKQ